MYGLVLVVVFFLIYVREFCTIIGLFYLTLIALIVCVRSQSRIQYQWKMMHFSFSSLADYNRAIANEFNAKNAIPTDVQPYYDSKGRLRTFLTLPKFKTGVPFTLAEVFRSNIRGYPPFLEAYPNISMHDNQNGKNCDAITSAFGMAITECNQMWVIDSGMEQSNSKCSPQLLLFDLRNDQLIHRYRFHKSLYDKNSSLFITPLVNVKDSRNNCQNTMVYVADVNNHGLVVYDYKNYKAWRIDNKYMYPVPEYVTQTLAGVPVKLRGGIFGLATDKINLYFHPLASKTEYAVPLNIIEKNFLFINNSKNMLKHFKRLGKRNAACLSSAMDSKNNLYCVTLDPIQLLKWNVSKPYNNNNIESLPINPKNLEFVSGIKVLKNPDGGEDLWLLSNRYQITFRGTPNWNEVHFRIIVRPLDNNNFAKPKKEN